MSDPRQTGFEQLLKDFGALPQSKPRPKTMLEVTRFPRSELAYSNILAFFLDPSEEHGLVDLMLRSLVELTRPELASYRLHFAKVKREDRTENNKSIDLVVLGDSFVIGIENKIDADVYNPFEDYSNWLE